MTPDEIKVHVMAVQDAKLAVLDAAMAWYRYKEWDYKLEEDLEYACQDLDLLMESPDGNV